MLGLHSKGSNLLDEEKSNNQVSRDASPIAASVALMESKLEQLTTIVKSAQKMTNNENSKQGLNTPRNTPKKSGGSATSVAGPFQKGKKPI